MREIKFRAWDSNEGVMIHNIGITPDGTAYVIPNETGESDSFEYYPDRELMQYTGLKDDDFNSLYEKDLVITRDAGAGEIIMHKQGFWAIRLFNINGSPEHYLYSHVQRGGCRKIGNIYENAELLNA